MDGRKSKIIYVCFLVAILVFTWFVLFILFFVENPRDFKPTNVQAAFSLAIENTPNKTNIVSSTIDYDPKERLYTNVKAVGGEPTREAHPVNPQTGKPDQSGESKHGMVVSASKTGFSVTGINDGRILSCPSDFYFDVEKGICVHSISL